MVRGIIHPNYTSYGGLFFPTKQDEKGRGNGYSREVGQVKKIGSSNQDQTDKPLLGKEIKEGTPGEKVWVDNVVATVRAETFKGEDTLTLSQRISLNQERKRTENCEQRRLIFELYCDKEAIPTKLIPDAALVYKILQEKLSVEKNSQQITITAMFTTDPSKLWFWSVIFDSTATK